MLDLKILMSNEAMRFWSRVVITGVVGLMAPIIAAGLIWMSNRISTGINSLTNNQAVIQNQLRSVRTHMDKLYESSQARTIHKHLREEVSHNWEEIKAIDRRVDKIERDR